jgi:hypothetical protein
LNAKIQGAPVAVFPNEIGSAGRVNRGSFSQQSSLERVLEPSNERQLTEQWQLSRSRIQTGSEHEREGFAERHGVRERAAYSGVDRAPEPGEATQDEPWRQTQLDVVFHRNAAHRVADVLFE